jgi:PAS domain S-box-containing protein
VTASTGVAIRPHEAYPERMHTPGGGSGWEELFWLVFARSSNPILLLDEDRRFLAVNDPALAVLGRQRAEVIGTSIIQSIRAEEREQAVREWESFLISGEYSGHRELLRGDGSAVAVDFAARMAVVGGARVAVYVITVEGDAPQGLPPSVSAAGSLLSMREREVVTRIALGRDTRAIAGELHISPETVRTHVRNAMAKLGVHSRAQLVAVVLCDGRMLELPHPGE